MEERIKKSSLFKTDIRAVIDKKIMIKYTEELFLIEDIIINGIYCNCRKKYSKKCACVIIGENCNYRCHSHKIYCDNF